MASVTGVYKIIHEMPLLLAKKYIVFLEGSEYTLLGIVQRFL